MDGKHAQPVDASVPATAKPELQPDCVTDCVTGNAVATHYHGTVTGYIGHRCRCRPCTDAWTAYHRGWRDRQSLGPDDPRHGTLNGYSNFRCRCAECRAAKRDATRAARAAS